MFKYQTAWQRDGMMLTDRFVAYLPKQAPSWFNGKEYVKRLEIGLIGSLLLLTLVFVSWQKIESSTETKVTVLQELSVEEIPKTEQTSRAPAPRMPTVPVASEDEDIPEDETIDFTDLDIDADPPPPPPPPTEAGDEIMFIAFDEPPKPVGGLAAVKRNVRYPDVAQRAGIEGTVVLNLRIDKDGSIKEVRVIQSVLPVMDKAAEDAVRSVKWKPAMQREDPVAVWYVVPIEFKLRSN